MASQPGPGISRTDRKGRLIPAERAERIRTLLERRQVISVSALVRDLGVSEVTVRRDLARLEQEGWLRRTRGGALAVQLRMPNLSYRDRATTEPEAKLAIGRAAAELVSPGEVVFLGSGSTSFAVARAIAERRRATIVTNSVHVLGDATICEALEVISTGGWCDARAGALVGPVTLEAVERFRAHKAFVGCSGIAEDGVFNESLERAAVARGMIENSAQAYVVVDHTKFGHRSLTLIRELNAFSGVITDREPDEEFAALLQRLGVALIVAEKSLPDG